MATTRIFATWDRLAATWGELADLASVVGELSGPLISFQGSVRLRSRTVDVVDVDDFRAAVDDHTRRDVVSARFEARGTKGVTAVFDIARGLPSARLSVTGEDLTLVEGVHQQLRTRIDRLSPWPSRRLSYLLAILFAVATSVTLTLLAQRAGMIATDERDSIVPGMVLIALAAGVFIPLVVTEWIAPNLEVLERSGQHRMRRLRGVLVGALIAIVVGLLTNAIWDVFAER